MDFKVGDIVRLRSGGPRMTVEVILPDMPGGPVVACSWFDENNQHHDRSFAPAALERV
jgi:uncharacterized protein YodC (DUF2158 family)